MPITSLDYHDYTTRSITILHKNRLAAGIRLFIRGLGVVIVAVYLSRINGGGDLNYFYRAGIRLFVRGLGAVIVAVYFSRINGGG